MAKNQLVTLKSFLGTIVPRKGLSDLNNHQRKASYTIVGSHAFKMRGLIIVGLILLCTDTFSCSCGRIGILKNKRRSDVVFVGRVVEIKEIKTEEQITGTDHKVEYRRFVFKFEVLRNYKGLKKKGFITITTTGGGADCGNYFDQGKKYLVYSRKHEGKLMTQLSDQKTEEFLTTSVCTRTKRLRAMTFLETFVLWLG